NRQPIMTITVIKNAVFVVGWDAAAARHVYLNDADVAFDGNVIVHVGPGYVSKAGERVEEVGGRGKWVMPGLINIHSHPASEPLNKGYTDDVGSPGLYNSGLYEVMPLMRGDAEAAPHCLNQALGELLLSEITTLVDMSGTHETWIDVMAASGIRG